MQPSLANARAAATLVPSATFRAWPSSNNSGIDRFSEKTLGQIRLCGQWRGFVEQLRHQLIGGAGGRWLHPVLRDRLPATSLDVVDVGPPAASRRGWRHANRSRHGCHWAGPALACASGTLEHFREHPAFDLRVSGAEVSGCGAGARTGSCRRRQCARPEASLPGPHPRRGRPPGSRGVRDRPVPYRPTSSSACVDNAPACR